jgi:hypothetical protein
LVTHRRGASTFGCLFTAALVGIVLYFGANIGGVYWRAYQYQDDMQQLMKYTPNRPNDAILIRLRAAADSLDLPEGARTITIHRTAKTVELDADYDEHLELPLFKHDFHLHPHAEGTP